LGVSAALAAALSNRQAQTASNRGRIGLYIRKVLEIAGK
jgi:hypothetical protein